ncbi:methyltransferase type 11 [Fusarium langsethiae]|uniref:Methyltransferase type 11 n=1 Tax=Fusarium langsethiae TaxID=179993 RepID=A0A0N0DAU6_FUSLA|nr:methyltransferase type 11 [Fusarium langsethiae]GKU12050.1 unnamed protein product [Fusarium langsethiae]GKU12469.1 unnamed protein product [Fusarium langsethiae]
MHQRAIEEWLDEVSNSGNCQIDEQQSTRKRKHQDIDSSGYLISPMSSPSKRPSTVPLDPEQTPRSLNDIQNTQFRINDPSSFTADLTSRASSPSPSKRRRQSPSKRHTTTATLKQLDPPIHVINPPDIEAVLPQNAQPLYDELYLIINKSSIVPPNLKRIMSSEAIRRAKILQQMWQEDDDLECDQHLTQEYASILDILKEATEAGNMNEGESAWNAQVHYPLLKLALSPFSSIKARTITSAQIVKDFRPKSKDSGLGGAAESSAKSSRSSLLSSDTGIWTEPESSSVHRMVDFAIVLIPDEALQGTIDDFLSKQTHATINQTTYDALATRPAPVFIETKASNSMVSRSQVQLGIWTAAWFQRLRVAQSAKDPIAIPVIQVYGHVWHVLFAMDDKDKILILDQSIRIGDTATVVGIYQLIAALRAIGNWMNTTFQLWIGEFLEGAQTLTKLQS